jgi:hypothetical protein
LNDWLGRGPLLDLRAAEQAEPNMDELRERDDGNSNGDDATAT